jgi:metal-dependent hydrolase (beta-lactamase superfamily II)
MRILVELPDDIAEQEAPGRSALELLVAAGYAGGQLTHCQCSQLLGLDRFDVDAVLLKHGVIDHAESFEDFVDDFETMRRNRIEGMMR